MRVALAAVAAALALPGAALAAPTFLLDGGGWGHGVGMSQWGAEGYAEHGYDYRRILAHYYPHTSLQAAAPRPVRVLLLQGQRVVHVSSAAPFLVVDARGRKLHLPSAVAVTPRLVVRRLHLRAPLRFEPGAEPLAVDGDGYRGDLVLRRKPGGLEVVNELPLDRYLRGVVPWEVPTGWDEAAYEAQAVAARSYTLATLHPHADFDLYPDTRDQMYGGIRAERPQTNLAIGATAGQVLTWDGTVIRAYYFSSSGGWTSAIQDAWPGRAPEPYLVSVRDPYDSVSPHHRWPTQVVSAAWLGGRLGLHGVRDVVVDDDGSHHVATASFLTPAGWKSFSGAELRQKLRLQSTYFSLGVFSLDPPSRRSLLSSRVIVRGEVRALHGVQLQRQDGASWRTVAYVHPRGDRFAVTLRTDRPLRLRLVAEGVPTAPVVYRVS
ncbi:MAG TPA: SpoIID/LytB domain-containing protein [Gaiellaceae bacterium]|nr:SpoIID/LytB domain-containing protein [Gaiellaceae bacterium]